MKKNVSTCVYICTVYILTQGARGGMNKDFKIQEEVGPSFPRQEMFQSTPSPNNFSLAPSRLVADFIITHDAL